MTVRLVLSGSPHGEFVRFLFLEVHRETDLFFSTSGVQVVVCNLYHFHRTAFSSQIKSKVTTFRLCDKDTVSRVNLNIDETQLLDLTLTLQTLKPPVS